MSDLQQKVQYQILGDPHCRRNDPYLGGEVSNVAGDRLFGSIWRKVIINIRGSRAFRASEDATKDYIEEEFK